MTKSKKTDRIQAVDLRPCASFLDQQAWLNKTYREMSSEHKALYNTYDNVRILLCLPQNEKVLNFIQRLDEFRQAQQKVVEEAKKNEERPSGATSEEKASKRRPRAGE